MSEVYKWRELMKFGCIMRIDAAGQESVRPRFTCMDYNASILVCNATHTHTHTQRMLMNSKTCWFCMSSAGRMYSMNPDTTLCVFVCSCRIAQVCTCQPQCLYSVVCWQMFCMHKHLRFLSESVKSYPPYSYSPWRFAQIMGVTSIKPCSLCERNKHFH